MIWIILGVAVVAIIVAFVVGFAVGALGTKLAVEKAYGESAAKREQRRGVGGSGFFRDADTTWKSPSDRSK